MSITITLPLPPKELSPNARPHFHAKARKVKAYRKSAAWQTFAILQGDKPRWKQATAQASFFFTTKRERDKDNLLASLKSAFDGIADAGAVANDSGITHLPVTVAVDKAYPRVVITITPIEEKR